MKAFYVTTSFTTCMYLYIIPILSIVHSPKYGGQSGGNQVARFILLPFTSTIVMKTRVDSSAIDPNYTKALPELIKLCT